MRSLPRAMYRHLQRGANIRQRQVPTYGTRGAGGTPRVFYLAPDRAEPSGGIRVIYRHVDLLRSLGWHATVMHHRKGFRCRWFESSTPVVHAAGATLGPEDVLVVPEWYGPGLADLTPGPRVVVFNQRAYDTFDWVEGRGRGAPYADVPGLIGLLTVSTDNLAFLRYVFPDLPVHLTRNVVDPAVFFPGDAPDRGHRLAFTGNRRPEDRERLLRILDARGVLESWQVSEIAGMTERETATVMRRSAIYLSFNQCEGFGLPPAEAMACGCYVVGYHGLAGREYFDPSDSVPVPDEDLIAFARAVEQACGEHEEDPARTAARGRSASRRVLATYCLDGLQEDLRRFYEPVLGPPGPRAALDVTRARTQRSIRAE